MLGLYGKYTGYPDKIKVDQGNQYISIYWSRKSISTEIEDTASGLEIHNSIRADERYHELLKRIYQ